MIRKTLIVAILLSFVLNPGFSQSFTQSRQTYDSLGALLKLAKNDTSRVNAMVELSNAFKFSEPDSAIHYALKALILSRQIKYRKGEQWALFYIGFTNEGLGNFPRAMHVYLEALQVSDKCKIIDARGYVLQRLGFIYLSSNDFPKSLMYTFQSMRLLDSLHNDSISIISQIHMADAYLRMNKVDSAEYYAVMAYNNMVRFNVMWLKTETLFFLGNVQQKKGNASQTIHFYRKALASAYHDTSHFMSYNTIYEIAELHKFLNEPDSSIIYAQESLEAAQRDNLYSVIIKASSLLSTLYEKKNRSKALYYGKIALAAKDSLNIEEKAYALQNLVGFDEQERQFEIETAKTAYQNKVKLFSLSVGLAVFLLIAFILYRNNLQKHRYNKILEKTLANLKLTQAQLIQSEKMASLGELTAGIGHEIKNPLNFINNFSDLAMELLEELKSGPLGQLPPDQKEQANELITGAIQSLRKVVHHGERADAIVKGMLQHARPSMGHRELTDINALADEYLRLSYHGLQEKDSSFNAKIATEFDKNIEMINVVPQELGRVFLNLYTNALYSLTEKKKKFRAEFVPTIIVATKKLAEKIEVRIRDNGLGISQKIIDKIFRPFFTTKPSGEGTGLGLSLSYDVIRAHGGEIKVESSEGEWAEFIIEIPVKS